MKCSFRGVLGILTLALLGQVGVALAANDLIRVQGGPWMLEGRAFAGTNLSPHPHLIVVLHGDAPGRNPSYQYRFASNAAAALHDAVVVGLLRPGYKDPLGDQSEGKRGWALADNYTPEDVSSVAAAAKELISKYQAADLTLVGHSGGSAIAADIVALFPHLARGALLVSCPCDVTTFRWSMMKYQRNPLWLIPVNAVSPLDHVAQIPADTIVRMVVGSIDPVTPPTLTFEFAGRLKATGGNVEVLTLPNLGHEILLEPAVLEQLRILVNAPSVHEVTGIGSGKIRPYGIRSARREPLH